MRGQPSERELVLAAKECRGEARGALIGAFTPQIERVVTGYGGVSGRAELMQQGVVGLLRALDRYDPELGVPFWAYASWWVRQAVQQLPQGDRPSGNHAAVTTCAVDELQRRVARDEPPGDAADERVL